MKIKNIWNKILHALFMLSPKYREIMSTQKVFWDNLANIKTGKSDISPVDANKIPTLSAELVVPKGTQIEELPEFTKGFLKELIIDEKAFYEACPPIPTISDEEQKRLDEAELDKTKALYQRLAGIELERHVEFVQYGDRFNTYKTKTFDNEKLALKFLKENGFIPNKEGLIEEATIGDLKFIRVINPNTELFFNEFPKNKSEPVPDFDHLAVITCDANILKPEEIVELVSAWKPAEAILQTPEEKSEINNSKFDEESFYTTSTMQNASVYKSPYL